MAASKEDYIRYRIKKSDEVFEDAKLLAKNGRWNSCVNRLYYSAFYLVSALLFQKGIKAETHNGVKTQFFQHFVKTGRTQLKFGKLYSHLFDWRQETDYGDFVEFEEETVEPLLNQVRELNSEVHHLIDS